MPAPCILEVWVLLPNLIASMQNSAGVKISRQLCKALEAITLVNGACCRQSNACIHTCRQILCKPHIPGPSWARAQLQTKQNMQALSVF